MAKRKSKGTKPKKSTTKPKKSTSKPKKSTGKKQGLIKGEHAIRELLSKQSVSTKKGFLKKEFKDYIVDELVYANKDRGIDPDYSLQDRYNRYSYLYDKFFDEGLQGHPESVKTLIERQKSGAATKYFLKDKGVIKQVSNNELAYKLELFSHKLATKYDIVNIKFKPLYKMIAKGKYEITINLPDYDNDISMDEDTVEDIMEYFDSEGVSITISDPNEIKDPKQRKKAEKSKSLRKQYIRKQKEKYYKLWKGKKR